MHPTCTNMNEDWVRLSYFINRRSGSEVVTMAFHLVGIQSGTPQGKYDN
jgi:hypothetical protein